MKICHRLGIAVALALWALNTAHAADKVIISYSSRSYAFLPAQVAVARGFFKDENLEPLLIQMRSQVAVPALMSGEVNYAQFRQYHRRRHAGHAVQNSRGVDRQAAA